MSGFRSKITPVAESIPFDNDTNEFVSEDVQAAIEEVQQSVQTSASPGFSFGRSGNISSNTFLLNEGVISNRAGRWVYINDATIKNIYVGAEDIDTFDVVVYHHEGDAINQTLVGSVSVVAARGGSFTVNMTVPTDKQLSVRIENGSAKNIVVGLSLSGTNI